MIWECSEMSNTEDGFQDSVRREIFLESIAHGLKSLVENLENAPHIESTRRSHRRHDVMASDLERRAWFVLIEEYTSRNMSFQSDKLPALSGVISALEELTGDICVAGIWKNWFLHGLLWRLQQPEWDMYVLFPKPPQRAMPWRAPTWSFASVEGVVIYTLLENDPGVGLCAELLDCDVTPKGVNRLGELTKGFARIRAPVAAVFDIAPQQSNESRACKVRMTDDRLADGSVYFDIDVCESCEVVMVTPHTGIAIIPVNVAESTYRRVGALSVYRVIESTSKDCEPESPEPFNLNRDKSLTASHYPSPTIITLL
jgi:hypothetical protein